MKRTSVKPVAGLETLRSLLGAGVVVGRVFLFLLLSSVLAWRIPGTGEPGGLPSMGSHRVGHD